MSFTHFPKALPLNTNSKDREKVLHIVMESRSDPSIGAMPRGLSCYALSGLVPLLYPCSQGVALGCHVLALSGLGRVVCPRSQGIALEYSFQRSHKSFARYRGITLRPFVCGCAVLGFHVTAAFGAVRRARNLQTRGMRLEAASTFASKLR